MQSEKSFNENDEYIQLQMDLDKVLAPQLTTSSQGKIRLEGFQWKTQKSLELVKILSEKGINPVALDRAPGGTAYYRNVPSKTEGLVWPAWEIRDEYVLHMKPKPHIDVLYGTAILEIPVEKVPYLTKISESIIYEPLTKRVKAGCDGRFAAIATLSIVREYAEGEISLEQAIDEYDRRIILLKEEEVKSGGSWQGSTPLADAYEKYILS